MRPVDELKSDVIAEVETHKAELIAIADAIHANPEIAFEEYDAAELLSGTLEESGYAVERGAGGLDTAFVATLQGVKDRPRIAFLAEYDALPELGHACGHNLIATAALGAGLAMRTVISELEGAVQVIGTPAEERGGGKVILVDAGVFDGVDAAMMVHPANYNMTRRTSLTSHKAIVEFFGKPAHAAAAPDEGINALDALIQTFNGVNALRQHLRDDARIHGIITHGGKATNIVPDYAAAQFGIRAADVGYAQRVIAKVRACAEAGALATGARLKFMQPNYSYANMMPNPVLADLTDANMAALGIEVRLPSPKERMGSSDMGNVSQVVPALHSYISIGSEDIVGHTAAFREAAASPEGHDGMIKAAQFLAMTAIDLLATPAKLREALKAFRQQKGGTDLV